MRLWTRILLAIGITRRGALIEIDDELEAHRAHAQDELERAGLSPADAAVESRRRMGNVTLAREDSREVWVVRWADRLRQHLRYGVRGLRREPAFALAAILTLALGTAAATTVFAVVDAEIWRRLPFADPQQLVSMTSQDERSPASVNAISIAGLNEWRETIPAVAGLGAEGRFARRTVRLDHAESATSSEVTANYFDLLGRRARLGRVFSDEDAAGSNSVVLSERGWRRVFDADPNVVGRAFILDDQPKVVVGVVATNDSLHPDMDLYVPIDERLSAPEHTAARFYEVIGRLRPGTRMAVAREQLQTLLNRHAESSPTEARHVASVEDLSAFYKRDDKRPLYFFLSAAALVLVLTVVNVAALFLSRTLRRAPEFALRGALGGGARAVAAQLVTESALVAVPGCVIGLWLAAQTTRVAGTVIPPDFLLRGMRVGLDARVALFVFVVAMVATTGLALIPRGVARRVSIASALGAGGRTSGTASAGRARAGLLTTQLALTVILLAGAGMFAKSFAALIHVPLGFDPSSGWSMRVALTGPRYNLRASDAQPGAPLIAYANGLVEHARGIPGISDAAVATSSPLLSGSLVVALDAGQPAPPSGGTRAILRSVGAGYFRAIGTPIVRGRAIADTDVAGAEPVAVINERMVLQHFGGADPIGRRVDLSGMHAAWFHNSSVRVVGVAADVKDIFLNEAGMADVYVPFAQQPSATFELIARGHVSDESMPGLLRAAATAVDPSIPATGISMLARRVQAAAEGDRFNLTMVAGFAIIALLIAAVGIYGAMAYAATAGWRESGVRLALGASPRDLLAAALWRAARVGLVGGAVGIAGAMALALVIGNALYLVPGQHNGLLFNVKTTDPIVLVSALGGVVLVALIAGAVPARRVARVDPVTALRAE